MMRPGGGRRIVLSLTCLPPGRFHQHRLRRRPRPELAILLLRLLLQFTTDRFRMVTPTGAEAEVGHKGDWRANQVDCQPQIGLDVSPTL
eukprot:1273225-Amphidinium_carterae.1